MMKKWRKQLVIGYNAYLSVKSAFQEESVRKSVAPALRVTDREKSMDFMLFFVLKCLSA